jgi:hypothetical protein
MGFTLELDHIIYGKALDPFRFSFNGKIGRSQKPLIRADNFFIIIVYLTILMFPTIKTWKNLRKKRDQQICPETEP